MKPIKYIILFLISVTSLSSKAQAIKPLPEFKNEIVVIKTYEEPGGLSNGYLDVSDGSDVKYTVKLGSLKAGNQPENASTLAQVLNELKKQKYKLIESNSGSTAVAGAMTVFISNYILQKE